MVDIDAVLVDRTDIDIWILVDTQINQSCNWKFSNLFDMFKSNNDFVVILARKSLNATACLIKDLCVGIEVNNKKIFGIYNKPSENNLKGILSLIEDYIVTSPCIIFGDFNATVCDEDRYIQYLKSDDKILRTWLCQWDLHDIYQLKNGSKTFSYKDRSRIDHCFGSSEWLNDTKSINYKLWKLQNTESDHKLIVWSKNLDISNKQWKLSDNILQDPGFRTHIRKILKKEPDWNSAYTKIVETAKKWKIKRSSWINDEGYNIRFIKRIKRRLRKVSSISNGNIQNILKTLSKKNKPDLRETNFKIPKISNKKFTITKKDIFKVIKVSPKGKACGFSGLNFKFFKILKENVWFHLKLLYNSILDGTIEMEKLEDLKKGLVILIPKDNGDARPITLLNCK